MVWGEKSKILTIWSLLKNFVNPHFKMLAYSSIKEKNKGEKTLLL